MTVINPSAPELVAAVIFAIAVLHTFSTKFFAHLAHINPRHAGVWHLLAEVEVVFGFWAAVLVIALFSMSGKDEALRYLTERNFTEPLFVFCVMVIAASKPILEAVLSLIKWIARAMPIQRSLAMYFLCLAAVPLLGSLITEPAAMTLAALMLKETFYSRGLSERLKYATIGVLFVNVSIGGTLTSFAAPPVLMVAAKWQWDSWFMLTQFGWKALVAVVFNAAAVTFLFRAELLTLKIGQSVSDKTAMPWFVTMVHVAFLSGVVMFAHYSVVFMGLFLFFMGYVEAYKRHQDPLLLRQGLMVAFFLAGLVTLGGLQQWWLQPALGDLHPTALYFIATALTAITDNAALTYLGSLVQGITPEFKYMLVAGAVTGGGLTVIANAPNPAGYSILKDDFRDQSISPLWLFVAAVPPTVVAILAFLGL